MGAMMDQSFHSSLKDGRLNKWRWDPDLDDMVRDDEELPPELQEIIQEAGEPKGVSTEQFERMFNSERFRSAVAKGLNFTGKVGDIESLKINAEDVAFKEAMEIIYRRLLDGPGQHLLALMSNDDLVDFFIVSAWAGPFGYSVFKEIKTKKKKKTISQDKPPTETVKETDEINIIGEGFRNE